jgi:hydrogenase maturation protein HypF
MELEALARKYSGDLTEFYPLPIRYNRIDWRIMLEEMISDLSGKADKSFIAKKFFLSLVRLMEQVSDIFDINDLAFSGGVFQNALLTEMITEQLSVNKRFHFHRQVSPNDECISLGQLAMHEINNMGIVEHSALFQKLASITH